MKDVERNPNKFKQFCADKGMTASEVADIVGCTKRAIHSYWQGQRKPSRETMKKMKEKLGIGTSEIYEMFED